jgi:solute carrier family 23 (nucleobase transporter), member 1
MGLSVPAFFGGVPALGFPAHEVTVGPDWFREMIEIVGSTGMAVAALLGILLDNLIPGTDEERGLVAPPGVTPTEVSEIPRQ